MLENLSDYEPKANTYREQPPLRPPIMSPSDLVYSSVSPRFESLMNRSNPSAWSPQPLDTPGTALQTDFGSNSQRYVKTSDNWHENIVESRTSELWSPSQVQAKPVDIPTRPQYVSQSTKPRDSTSARIFSGKQTERSTNSFAKTNDRANTSHSSSNIPMINSSTDKSSGAATSQCSPRCKLGTLGFAIGLLLVAIPLAVILVLWLRQ